MFPDENSKSPPPPPTKIKVEPRKAALLGVGYIIGVVLAVTIFTVALWLAVNVVGGVGLAFHELVAAALVVALLRASRKLHRSS